MDEIKLFTLDRQFPMNLVWWGPGASGPAGDPGNDGGMGGDGDTGIGGGGGHPGGGYSDADSNANTHGDPNAGSGMGGFDVNNPDFSVSTVGPNPNAPTDGEQSTFGRVMDTIANAAKGVLGLAAAVGHPNPAGRVAGVMAAVEAARGIYGNIQGFQAAMAQDPEATQQAVADQVAQNISESGIDMSGGGDIYSSYIQTRMNDPEFIQANSDPMVISYINQLKQEAEVGSYLSNADPSNPYGVALAVAQQGRADFEPYRQIGLGSVDDYNNMLRGEYDHKTSPAAQWTLQEATKFQNRQDAARGLAGSGHASERLGTLASRVYASDYQDQYNRILDSIKIGTGASAAAGASSSGLAGVAANQQQALQNQSNWDKTRSDQRDADKWAMVGEGLSLYQSGQESGLWSDIGSGLGSAWDWITT